MFVLPKQPFAINIDRLLSIGAVLVTDTYSFVIGNCDLLKTVLAHKVH